MVFGPPYPVFQHCFGLVAQHTCKTMGVCNAKAKIRFSNLKMGGYLAHTPWDTLFLAPVGEV